MPRKISFRKYPTPSNLPVFFSGEASFSFRHVPFLRISPTHIFRGVKLTCSARYTNLHLAAFAGDVRIVLDCVRGNNGFPQCGIDETDEQGFTALMYAAKSGNSAVVSKLLELGCDANILNNDGMSALQVLAGFHFTAQHISHHIA